MRYHVMTVIRGRMTTKGPEAPAMLGHPDIMVFVLVVFWCVTLCDFVTCYSGCKNSCKYLMYVRVTPVLQPRLQKLQRNSWGVTYHNRVSRKISWYVPKYRDMWAPLCNRSCKTGCKNHQNFATFATHFVSAHVTAAGILSTAPLYIMIKYQYQGRRMQSQ